ncbi:MAG: signal peptidase II [Candidatus Azotimanducaceae bacterium]|jgi:signal peptidase II
MIYFLIPIVIVVSDQASKYYMSNLLSLCSWGNCPTIEILPVFKLVVLHNYGAAFSFLDDAGGWQRWFLVSISFGVSVFVASWLYKVRRAEMILSFGLAFILGGAIGNLIDRVNQGYVVDFLLFHWNTNNFPAFNIADSAIFIGACFLILDALIKPKEGNDSSNERVADEKAAGKR